MVFTILDGELVLLNTKEAWIGSFIVTRFLPVLIHNMLYLKHSENELYFYNVSSENLSRYLTHDIGFVFILKTFQMLPASHKFDICKGLSQTRQSVFRKSILVKFHELFLQLPLIVWLMWTSVFGNVPVCVEAHSDTR